MQVTLDLLFNKALMTLAVGGVGYIIMFPFRKARKEWVSLKETTAKIHDELTQQRTNCLQTLQSQGDKQIEILEKVSNTLTDISLSQAKMTGFCEANSIASSCRPRTRAKK